MKIGMILDKVYPPDPRVDNEASSLIKAGHQVYLYCFDYTGKLPKEEVIKGIHVCRYRMPKWIYSISALAFTVPLYHNYLVKSLSHFLKKNSIEHIHIHDMQVANAVYKANRLFKLPTLLDLHENRPEIMKFYEHVNSFMGKRLISPEKWKRAEFKAIEKADKVVVVTQEAKEYYIEKTDVRRDKILVVPNTVRKDFKEHFTIYEEIESRDADKFIMLYVGDTGSRRGLDTVLDALPIIRKQIPNIKLNVVGTSKYHPQLIQKAKQLELEDLVDFHGWQNFEKFPSFIRNASIGICPIHRNIHHDTTFANKIFQYMSFGKPILVSDCPAQEAVVKEFECGLIFKDQDKHAFAKQLIKIALDSSYYSLLSDNALKAVETYWNWENTSRGLVEYYTF